MARKRGMQYIPYDYEAAYNKAMEDIWDCSNTRTHTTITLITSNQKTTSRNSRG